jgi:NTE family protein
VHKLEVFQFDKEKRIASYDFSDFTLNLFWQANPTNNTALGGGIAGDYSWLANRVGLASIPESESLFLNVHAFYKIDTYDKDFYPTHGSQLTTEIKYAKDISDDAVSQSSFFQGSVRFSNAIPISRKFTLLNHFFAGTSTEDSIPVHYSYYLGGLGGTYLRGLVPFVGLKYMQLTGSHAIAAGSDIRAELWKDNFLALKINVCKATYARKNIFSFDDITYGGGISYGYRSAIGPMEVTFMTSNNLKGFGGFINIGYWF